LEQIVQLQDMKTGALFRYSLQAGAILGQADLGDRHALVDYANKVGLAFQIADDILDTEGDEQVTGKRTGRDEEAGKATFVQLMGLDGAKRKARELVDEACMILDRFDPRGGLLRDAATFIVERKS